MPYFKLRFLSPPNMNNNFDEQKHGNEHENEDERVNRSEEGKLGITDSNEDIKVKPKKKSNFKTYISLVLVSSLISSSAVGGALYSKFSSELRNQNALIQKAVINAGLGQTNFVNPSNGNIVKMKALDEVKKNYKAGDSVNLTVVRDGEKKKLRLTFTEEK